MSHFVSATTMTVGPGSGFTVAKPAGVQDGDLLVMAYSEGGLIGPGNISGSFTSPGWNFGFASMGLKIADNEPASWTFTGTVDPQYNESAVILSAWRIPNALFTLAGIQTADPSPVIRDNGSDPYADLVTQIGQASPTFYPTLVLTIGNGLSHRGGYFTPPGPYAFAEPVTTWHDATIRASVPSIVPSAATGGASPASPHTVDSFVVAETVIEGDAGCAADPFSTDQRNALTAHDVTVADPEAKAGTEAGSFGWSLRIVAVRLAFRAFPRVEFENVPNVGCAPLEVTYNNISPNAADISCWWWYPDIFDALPTYTVQNPPPHTYTTPGDYTSYLEAFSAKFNAYASWSDDLTVEDCLAPYWGILTKKV